jgi:hypothetical protein
MNFKKLVVLTLFVSVNVFSQIQNQNPNLKPKKILFTYVTVPNFYFEENKVYADSITLSKEFRNTKINFSKSPLDSTKIIAYINKKDIRSEDLDNFRSKIFHSFTDVNFEYKIKSKTLKYSGSLCKSDLCKNIFKEFFDKSKMKGSEILFTTATFYEKEQIIRYAYIFGDKDSSYKDRIVSWSDQFPDVGTYEYRTSHNNVEQKKLSSIYVNYNLDKHITPTGLFSNCEYGVNQIKNYFSTTVLTKVEYKY